MCAANLTNKNTPSPSSQGTNKPVPKWLKMKQQNKSSAGKTVKPTAPKSSGSAQKPHQETRNEKRARWAKKAKPVAKPVLQRGPVHEYISACCTAPATKPPCGTKVASIDPETGKPAKKDKTTGLGHFRCSQCRKACKVTPRKSVKAVEVDMTKVEQHVVFGSIEGTDLGRGTAIVGNGRPEVPIVG